MALDSFYQHHKFIVPPFESWIAEDKHHLPNWFIEPTFLNTLLGGLPSKPRPSSDIVFGSPGSGKTALRMTLERELQKRLPESLVLRYVDFGAVLTTSDRPPLAAHVEELL